MIDFEKIKIYHYMAWKNRGLFLQKIKVFFLKKIEVFFFANRPLQRFNPLTKVYWKIKYFRNISPKQMKRQLQCATDPRPFRAGSEQETVIRNPPRNRGYFSGPPRAFCIEKYNIPAIIPNFTEYCACHEKWHFNFTEYCACHEKWHLNVTK